jgi:L-lactate dehydrogenase complex protein LldG
MSARDAGAGAKAARRHDSARGRAMSARDAVLAAIRDALGPAPTVPGVPRDYRTAGGLEPDVDLFAERVAEYRATVHRVAADDLPALLAGLARGRTGIPPGFAFDGIEDRGLSVEELDALDTVITGCRLAIADTGTIVLDGGEASGRRALTLVPDHHICVVREGQVVASVPDAIAKLDSRGPLTFVSGPSATSDIELDRVEGVHGPRELDVVIVA